MNSYLNAAIKIDLNIYKNNGKIETDNNIRIKLMVSVLILILSVM